MTLREAIIQAMKRKQSNEARADAILSLLGLDDDDCIVSMEDLSNVLAYSNDAQQTLERYDFFVEDEDGNTWPDDELEWFEQSHQRLFTLLSPEYKVDDQ